MCDRSYHPWLYLIEISLTFHHKRYLILEAFRYVAEPHMNAWMSTFSSTTCTKKTLALHVRQVQRGRAEVALAYLYPRVHLEVVMTYSNYVLCHAELVHITNCKRYNPYFWFKLTKKLLFTMDKFG